MMFNTLPEIKKSLEDFVSIRETVVENTRLAHKHMDIAVSESKKIYSYLFPYDAQIKANLDKTIEQVDANFWRQTMTHTGLDSIMDKKAKDDFEDSLKANVPEFSMANIRSTFLSFSQEAEMIFNRGVVYAFQGLSPSYKTNKKEPFTLGRKFIIGYAFTNSGGKLSVSRHGHGGETIEDLHRIICRVLEIRYNAREIQYAIEAAINESGGVFENEYCRIKGYKNGNAHVQITSDKAIEGINLCIAKWYGENTLV